MAPRAAAPTEYSGVPEQSSNETGIDGLGEGRGMSVKRFDISGEHYEVFGDNNGEYCLYEDYAALEAKCAELAAESSKTSERLQQLIQIISNADNEYCMCGDAMKNHVHGGCGHPTGMFDYHYNQWLKSENKTPSTEAVLAEVRAQGVEMFASKCKEESKCAHSSDARDSWWVSGENADDFAAQLRQEAAQ